MPDKRLSDVIEIWWATHCYPIEGHIDDKSEVVVDIDVSLSPLTLGEIQRRIEMEWDTSILSLSRDHVVCTLGTAIDAWLSTHSADLTAVDAAEQIVTQVSRFDAADHREDERTLTPWLQAIASEASAWSWAQDVPVSYEQLHHLHNLPHAAPDLPTIVVGAAIALQAPTTRPKECTRLEIWLGHCGVSMGILDACLAYAYDLAHHHWWGDARGQG